MTPRLPVALLLLIALSSCTEGSGDSVAGPLELARQSLLSEGIVGMTETEAEALLSESGIATRFRPVTCRRWRRLGQDLSAEARATATVIAATRPRDSARWYTKILMAVVDDRVVDVQVGTLLSGC